MHHLNPLAIGFFIFGLVLHALAQIDAIARARGGSRLAVFKARWITILVRGAICTAFFVLWLQGQLADTLRALGVPLPDGAAAVLDLHVGGAIGMLAGYAFDSALGYVPILKSSIPPAIDATVTNLPPITPAPGPPR